MQWVQRVPWQAMGRWWIVGLAFYAGGMGILYLFVTPLHIPLVLATLISSEITLLLRFLINDRWVFGHSTPNWTRLWQYHVASAGGTSIWWIVTNTLPRFGVHYMIASTAGTACSVFFSMLSNFFWIWRRGSKAP
jgi:putative flippase GtrA